MYDKKREGQYLRIYTQLEELLHKTTDPIARMASICAVLHHKMNHYFWTGFYLLKRDQLIVGPYQGPLACQELEKNKGVCWASLNTNSTMIIPDVRAFPGHITCDARSKSEITIPVYDQEKKIRAVFDVDSTQPDAFNEVDKVNLQKITDLVYKKL